MTEITPATQSATTLATAPETPSKLVRARVLMYIGMGIAGTVVAGLGAAGQFGVDVGDAVAGFGFALAGLGGATSEIGDWQAERLEKTLEDLKKRVADLEARP